LVEDGAEPGVVKKEITEEALGTVKARDKYKIALDKDDLPKGEKLNAIAEAITDLHIIIIGSGKVSTTEAKNFNFFIKKEFDALIHSNLPDKEKGGVLLSAVVWSAFDKYLKYKMEKIQEIKDRKSARIQKILDRRK
jgi:hypothetical protein